MRLETIIKIIWRRKFYILLPFLIVPFFTLLTLTQITKEYETSSTIFINESILKNPALEAFGLKLNLEERLPSIKRLMRGKEKFLYLLGEAEPKQKTAEYFKELELKKNRLIIELKGPGVARLSYSGTDPIKVKAIVDRMAEAFIGYALQPYQNIGERLKSRIKAKDEILVQKLLPELLKATNRLMEVKQIFTPQSPEWLTAKYEYDSWKAKVAKRETLAVLKVKEILPLLGNNPDFSKLAKVIDPAVLPLSHFKPDGVKMMIISTIAGLALGFILTFIMEFLDHSLKETEDIERYLDLPIQGRIPVINLENNN